MALKDWKKIDEDSEEIIWENKKNDSQLGIHKTLAKEWSGAVNRGNGFQKIPKAPNYFKTKKEAMKFAMAYMRKH